MQDARERHIANRLTLGVGDVKLMNALGIATGGRHVLGVFIGAGLASVCWLLLAPRLWLHISQGLRSRLHYLEPGLSKKQPFAPFLLVGLMLTFAWLC